jgi:hypothetical protein
MFQNPSAPFLAYARPLCANELVELLGMWVIPVGVLCGALFFVATTISNA